MILVITCVLTSATFFPLTSGWFFISVNNNTDFYLFKSHVADTVRSLIARLLLKHDTRF